jgi:hypothetical protein
MADFNQLVAEVCVITNRPDLAAETALAVKSATLQLHRSDFYYKDLFETALVFDEENYLQAIDYRVLFPRYRALKYLRKIYLNGSVTRMGDFLDIITPENTLDLYRSDKTNVAYVAGDNIQIRSSDKITHCMIGIYQNPEVSTPEKYKSWISDEAFYAVVWKAASIMFGTILSNPAKKKSADDQVGIEWAEFSNSNITAEGY